MRKMTVFYAWQSDTERELNSDFIDIALREAARRITEDSSLGIEVQIDSDTQGVPGIPPVTDTILKKIASSDLFVPDVTFVARTNEGKLIPNPNVMTEFGYALHAKTHAAIMPIMNTAFGPLEALPFDMGHLRHPIQYSAELSLSDADRRIARVALSRTIEEKLRLQISATQPPAPAPMRFAIREPKNGPGRFRAPGEPIAKHWNDLPVPNAPRQDVLLRHGPALWLRLLPVADPGRTWPTYTLKERAIGGGRFDLAPFVWHNVFSLRADDGFGLCSLVVPDETETPSVAFAFETGEVWSVDTTLLALDSAALFVGEIEKVYQERLLGYGQFLTRLGLTPPYHWISGASGVKGRHLKIPVQPRRMTMPTFTGPECLSENIILEGTYDGKQTPGDALAPFFNAIFDKSGVRRSDYDLAGI